MLRRVFSPLMIMISMAGTALVAGGCGKAEDRGRQLYAERGCAVCHGAGGRGDGPSAGRLDIPPRDFANVRAYRHGSSQHDIAAPFRDLTDEQASDIAAWIVSLQRPPAGGPP